MERLIRTLAVEFVRLQRLAEKMPPDSLHAMALRHSLRRLRAELDAHDVSFLDLTGQPYDPGMAVEVLDTLGEGEMLHIAEMRQPIILWEGKLLAAGEVLLHAKLVVRPRGNGKRTPLLWHAQLSQKRNQRRQAHRRKRIQPQKGATT